MSSKPPAKSITFAKLPEKPDTVSNNSKKSDESSKDTAETLPTKEKPGCEFQWRCPLPTSGKVIIDSELFMMNVLRKHAKSRPVRCIIRRGPHDLTRTTSGAMVPDDLGWHITAQYLDPKDNMWYHLHLYLNKINESTYFVNKTLIPNPTWTAEPTVDAKALNGKVKRLFFKEY